MKKLLLFFALFTIVSSCDKDDNNKITNPIDQLPPATQTGAGTFGCLVNGKPFVDNSGFFNCFYQFVDGEYYFSISAENTKTIPRNIRLSTNSLEIAQSNTYQLVQSSQGNAHAAVIFYFEGVEANENTTNQQYTGTLSITKMDFQNKIVSGLFNFQIEDTITGDIYNITEGRFDAKFTQ